MVTVSSKKARLGCCLLLV